MTNIADWLNAKDLRLLLFDLDDTFVETNALFLKRFEACKNIILSDDPRRDPTYIERRISELNIESFKRMGGNLSKRWPYVTKKLVDEFNISNHETEKFLLNTLLSLYHELPSLKQDVHGTLKTLQSTGITMGLVTHANEAWTNFKVDGLNLRQYFNSIFIIHEDSFKTSQSWMDAMKYFHIQPGQTAIIGDSLRSDIIPGSETGAKKLYWIHEESGWSFYHEGEVPIGVTEVHGIANLLSAFAD